MQVTQGDTGEQASVTRAPHEHNQESSKTRDPASDGPATRAGNAVKSKLVRGCRSGRNGSERSEGASRCGPFGPHAAGWGAGRGVGRRWADKFGLVTTPTSEYQNLRDEKQ